MVELSPSDHLNKFLSCRDFEPDDYQSVYNFNEGKSLYDTCTLKSCLVCCQFCYLWSVYLSNGLFSLLDICSSLLEYVYICMCMYKNLA